MWPERLLVAMKLSESRQSCTTLVAALPTLREYTEAAVQGSGPQVEQMEAAVTECERPLTAGSAHSEKAERAHTRSRSSYSAKQIAMPLNSSNNGGSSNESVTAQQTNSSRRSSKSLSPQRPRTAPTATRRSPATTASSAHAKGATQRHRTSAATDFSRSAKLLTRTHMPAPQAVRKQEVRDAATDDPSVRLPNPPKGMKFPYPLSHPTRNLI
jgi:hypothetical protein